MLIKNLIRRRTRTLLTLLGIAAGIAAIVSLVSLSEGVAANFVEMTNSSAGDVTIQAVQDEGHSINLGTGFDESLAVRLRALPEVKSVSAMLYTMVAVPGAPVFVVYGYEPDQVGIRRFKVVEGVALDAHRTRRGGRPLLLGRVAADKLHKGVGDTVMLEEMTFRVVGIYETGVAFEDSGAVIGLRDAQTLANMPRQTMFLSVQLRHPDRVEAFEKRASPLLPRDVEIAGTQTASMMRDMLEMMDAFAWGVALIAALVGGVGMMNTVLMSVNERTREIGVLRAVGWSRGRVLGMIMGESLLLSAIGGLLGLGIGAGLTWAAGNTPAMQGLTQTSVPPHLAAQALSSALLLGVVGGAYPAWRASRLAPVEALSYAGGSGHGHVPRLRVGGMAFKNLLRQRGRTALTLLGIGVGILGVLLIGALMEGFMRSFGGIFAGTEITAVEADQPDTTLSAIDERVLKRIEALPEVRDVHGLIFAIASTQRNPFLVITAREAGDPRITAHALREGQLITGRRQCLLGWQAAEQQGLGVGDRLRLLGTRFTVVGIVEVGNALEDNGVIIGLREAQQLLKKPHQVMAMHVKLVDPAQTGEMIARLSADYPDLLFSQSSEMTEHLPDMQMTREWVAAIHGMTALVGSIALMNTMVMSVHERTREIGVLRALGWRPRMVLRQVMVESLILTAISGGAGVLVTLALARVLREHATISLLQDMVLTPRGALQALGMCMALGVVGGLYPAWRTTRFRPVEALRYE